MRGVLQAWLVPHEAGEAGSIGCGLGTVAAVHSGFSASWQSGLKQAVCSALQQAVKHSTQHASQMRMLVTGDTAHRSLLATVLVAAAAPTDRLLLTC